MPGGAILTIAIRPRTGIEGAGTQFERRLPCPAFAIQAGQRLLEALRGLRAVFRARTEPVDITLRPAGCALSIPRYLPLDMVCTRQPRRIQDRCGRLQVRPPHLRRRDCRRWTCPAITLVGR